MITYVSVVSVNSHVLAKYFIWKKDRYFLVIKKELKRQRGKWNASTSGVSFTVVTFKRRQTSLVFKNII